MQRTIVLYHWQIKSQKSYNRYTNKIIPSNATLYSREYIYIDTKINQVTVSNNSAIAMSITSLFGRTIPFSNEGVSNDIKLISSKIVRK